MSDNFIGSKFIHKKYGEYTVISFHSRDSARRGKFTIKFTDTGYESVALKENILKQNVKDKFCKCVYGVGFIGNGNRKLYEKEYRLWIHILERCYSKQDTKYKTYKNVFVCDRWHNFELFCADIPYIEGYAEWKSGFKYHLDKDLKQKDKDIKYYSPETCTFLYYVDNQALTDLRKAHKHEETKFLYRKLGGKEWLEFSGVKQFTRENPQFIQWDIYGCFSGKTTDIHGYEFKRVEEVLGE